MTRTQIDRVLSALQEHRDELSRTMLGGDKAERAAVERKLVELLRETAHLDDTEVRRLVWGEVQDGGHPIPDGLRGQFFGSPALYPDLAIGIPGEYFVAIEVGAGERASDLLNELRKAAWHSLMGKFDRCVLVYSRRGRFASLDPTAEDRLWLQWFETFFRVNTVLL